MRKIVHTTISQIVFLVLILATGNVYADPPKPPAGKVWILNFEMSDEFNSQSPDPNKWIIYDMPDSWNRTAAFDKRVLESAKENATNNYYLTMNPMWYYEDERFSNPNIGRTYLFAGGGMATKGMQTFGYFEVRIKPSDFPMGSGVFMNSRTATSNDCNTKYLTELDIIENMGYTGPFNEYGNGSFNNIQHVNSHIKPSSFVNGSCVALPYESENSGISGYPLDKPLDFNTVGMWWVDENSARFYNNDKFFGTITPKRSMYLPMPLILTMETYSWGDNDERNATNPKPLEWMFEDDFRTKEQRAVMYDWVRVWKLVDIDATQFNDAKDNIMAYDKTLKTNPGSDLVSTMIYSASSNREVIATLLSPNDVVIADTTYNVSQGVGSLNVSFKINKDTPVAEGYKIVYVIKDGETILKSDNCLVSVEAPQLGKKLWGDLVPTSIAPETTTHNIQVKYETDTASTIVLEMHSPNGPTIGYKTINVNAGNNVATLSFTTSPLTLGSNYFYKIYMYRRGYNWQDPTTVTIIPQIYFNVEAPLNPSIEITNCPTSILNTTKEIQVGFSYTTNANGILDLMLVDKNNNVLANEHREERIGSRALIRTIDVNSVLQTGNDFKIISAFTPYNNEFATISDTVSNVIITDYLTSNKLIKSDNDWNIYPIPTNGILYINTKENVMNAFISVIDLSGQIVYAENNKFINNSLAINLSNLKSGAYILRVVSGNVVHNAKIIRD